MKVSECLELELQMNVSSLLRVLGTKLRSSRRSVSALKNTDHLSNPNLSVFLFCLFF